MSWVAVAVAGAGVLGAGATVYGSKQAAKASKKSSGQQRIEDLLGNQMEATGPWGLELVGDSMESLDDLDEYFQQLSEGDRSMLMELLGPGFAEDDEMRRIASSTDAALAPGSAGSSAQRLDLLDRNVMRRENAIAGARTAARSSRGDIASARSQLGTALLSGTGSNGLGLLGSMLQGRQMDFEQQRAMGQALYQLMQQMGSYGVNYASGRTPTQPLPAYSNSVSNIAQFAPGTRS